jgi:hypothetical protein
MSEPQSALLLRKQLAGKPSKEYFSHTKNQHNYKKSDTPRRHQTTPKSPHSRGISPKTPRQLDPAPASPGQKRRNPKKSAPGTERPGPQRLAAERGGRLRGEAPRLSHFQFSPNCQKKFDICGGTKRFSRPKRAESPPPAAQRRAVGRNPSILSGLPRP